MGWLIVTRTQFEIIYSVVSQSCFLQQSFSSQYVQRVKERRGDESTSFLCQCEGATETCSGFVPKTRRSYPRYLSADSFDEEVGQLQSPIAQTLHHVQYMCLPWRECSVRWEQVWDWRNWDSGNTCWCSPLINMPLWSRTFWALRVQQRSLCVRWKELVEVL